MVKKGSVFIFAIVFFLTVSGAAIAAESLSIFWAEWDPANYLQELVMDFEAETGIKVTVELGHRRGGFPMAGRRRYPGPLCRLNRLVY